MRWDTVPNTLFKYIDYSDKISITGFNLAKSETLGSVKVELVIGSSCYMVKFHIVKELCVPAIIGAEFLKQYTLFISENFSSIILRKPDKHREYLPRTEIWSNKRNENKNIGNEYKTNNVSNERKPPKSTKQVTFINKSCQTEEIIDMDSYTKNNHRNIKTFTDKSCQAEEIIYTNKPNQLKTKKKRKRFRNKCIVSSMRNNQADSMLPECSTYYDNDFVSEPPKNIENRNENWEKDYVDFKDEMIFEDLDSNQDYSLVENKKYSELYGVHRIKTLFEILELKHLRKDQFGVMQNLIRDYADIFYLKGDRLTVTDAAIHEIETTTNVPINKRQYRFPEVTKKRINEEIEEMYRQGIIRPSKSPWNAPVLCIPKKDLDADGSKKYRIVVDFRALNLITKPFVYPIPNINEILDDLGDNIYFSTLDLKSGFYQVPIQSQDAPKTAFSTPKGHFEFTRMPMGLRNSPSTFQRLMNTVLYELGDIKAIVYLDDIIVFGKSIMEHNENLCKVLEAMRRHNLKLEPNKCQILKTEIKYLGHIIDRYGIRPTKDNIKSIREMSVPKTVKGVRSFLGTVNFYGKFIPKIAETRKPLNDLLRKNHKFIWTEDCQNAFEKLKNFLTSDSLLVRPNYKDKFVLTTDASEYAIGAVLSNEKSTDRPIAFASRGLIGAERKYHTIEKELLAIVWAVNHFKHYIYGQNFIVYTDHRPLISIWHLKETSPVLTRLRLKLQGLECDIRYKQGKDNVVADFLSRINPNEEPKGVAVVTRQQKQQQQQQQQHIDRQNLGNSIKTNPVGTKQICDWNQQMDGLNKMDLSMDEHNDEEKDLTYRDFEEVLLSGSLQYNLLKFTKEKIDEEKVDATLIILNSRSAFKELNELVELPHGLKDYVKGRIVSIPERKLFGLIVNGTSRSKLNPTELFEGLVEAFSNGPTYGKSAKNIQIISYRNLQIAPNTDILRFIAEKFDKNFTLYVSERHRTLVTPEDRETVLKEFHDSPLGGHVGGKRMLKRISPMFKWENMRRDIENYVKQCESCQKNKIWAANKIPMKITTTSSEPLDKIFMDIVVLPESNNNNKYGLVIQDDITRYLTVSAMENQESYTVAKCFVENFICKFGTPLEIVTDQGANFVSSLMKNVCKILKIKKITTSAYHPQANLVERSNRELKTYLRQFVGSDPSSWDQLLPYFTFEYNTTINSSTGFTPFELMYGRLARIPNSVYKQENLNPDYGDYVNEMKASFKRIHHKAKENLILSKQKRKEIYDKNAKEWQPMWGEMVLVKNNPTGVGQKLQTLWRGPYEVVELPSEQTTIIKNGKKLEKVHNNRLRKYND